MPKVGPSHVGFWPARRWASRTADALKHTGRILRPARLQPGDQGGIRDITTELTGIGLRRRCRCRPDSASYSPAQSGVLGSRVDWCRRPSVVRAAAGESVLALRHAGAYACDKKPGGSKNKCLVEFPFYVTAHRACSLYTSLFGNVRSWRRLESHAHLRTGWRADLRTQAELFVINGYQNELREAWAFTPSMAG